ncbi:tyrosine-protein phosphatase [Haliea sp. E17]|uniref:tyrosine-protein phosphatase n=1 Tax=Haliea sp. E17 TaxID=3401576 RepID=UPI003AAE4849
MIDLHCHFLPGIDDGARSLDEALQLARDSVANGVFCAVMTPHLHPGRWENFAGEIARQTALFRRALEEAGVDLDIAFAAEVRMSPEIPLLIERGHVPFLGEMDGYQLMLLEFPHGHIPLGADKLVWRLLQMKVRPVIAHPERNKDVMREPGKISPFVEMGCILQLTAASVCGRFGERAQRAARLLLETDADIVLATDAHNTESRPPILAEGRAAAARIVGEAAAHRMTCLLPQQIVASQFAGNLPSASAQGVDVAVSTVAVGQAEDPARDNSAVQQRERPAPSPGKRRSDNSPGESTAATGLDELLLGLVDERLRVLLAVERGADADGSGAGRAQQYHREIVRRLGGEIYRRVRREVLRELGLDASIPGHTGGNDRKVGP